MKLLYLYRRKITLKYFNLFDRIKKIEVFEYEQKRALRYFNIFDFIETVEVSGGIQIKIKIEINILRIRYKLNKAPHKHLEINT